MAVIERSEPWTSLIEDQRVVHQTAEHGRAARWAPLPEELHPALLEALRGAGIERLQSAGIEVSTGLKADEARALLSAEFDTVRERTLASKVRVTDPAPIVRHAASTTGARTSPHLVDRFTAEVASRIATDGCFEVSTEVVMFVAGRS